MNKQEIKVKINKQIDKLIVEEKKHKDKIKEIKEEIKVLLWQLSDPNLAP